MLRVRVPSSDDCPVRGVHGQLSCISMFCFVYFFNPPWECITWSLIPAPRVCERVDVNCNTVFDPKESETRGNHM